MAAPSARAGTGSPVLSAGSYHGVPGSCTTIRAAAAAAQPGGGDPGGPEDGRAGAYGGGATGSGGTPARAGAFITTPGIGLRIFVVALFAAREETTMTRRPHALHIMVGTALLALLVALAGIPSLLTAQQAAATVATPAGTAANCSSAPAGEAFYVPPDPLPPGQHGDIIWCRPVASPAPGATAWQVLYLSTTVSGARTAVSGTVLVPATPSPGTRPVVAYASGTQGWGDQCAPSKEMASGSYDEQFAVNNLLAQGWAVAVTDYPGLGTPGDETYAVGIPEGYAVLDALRAASLLPGAGLNTTAPMGIEGYSQGGGAAGWAAQLQPQYAAGLRLHGVAMGGTPANLQAVAANINGTAFFAFLGGAATGFNAAYPTLNLLSDLTPDGRAALAQLDTMCQGQALATYAGKRIEDYTTGGINPIGEPRWQNVLNANDLGATKPLVPVLQYHGNADEVIPWSVEAALHSQWCAMGVTSLFTSYPGDHVTTHLEAQTQVVSWLRARFAGTPAPSNC